MLCVGASREPWVGSAMVAFHQPGGGGLVGGRVVGRVDGGADGDAAGGREGVRVGDGRGDAVAETRVADGDGEGRAADGLAVRVESALGRATGPSGRPLHAAVNDRIEAPATSHRCRWLVADVERNVMRR